MEHSCVIKELPEHLQIEAAQAAVEINPQNSPRIVAANGLAAFAPLSPSHVALLTSRRWGASVDHGVQFLDGPDAATRRMILEHMNAWGQFANVRFRETNQQGDCRISRTSGEGYYSFLGTDTRSVPAGQPTMNLDSFTSQSPVSEYKRVVRHETGHHIGLPHEHERQEVIALLDVEKTVAWFQQNVGWDRQTTMQQVFEPLSPGEITVAAGGADARSIMCYQFDGACTKSGRPIPGGLDIDAIDAAFVSKIYPKDTTPVNPTNPTGPTNPAPGSYKVAGTLTLTPSTGLATFAPANTFDLLGLLAKIGGYKDKLIEVSPYILAIIDALKKKA